LKRVQEINPENEVVAGEINKVRLAKKNSLEKDKAFCTKMFGFGKK
jgi:hypothetical protein